MIVFTMENEILVLQFEKRKRKKGKRKLNSNKIRNVGCDVRSINISIFSR